ncbi:lysosomal-associated transmembrane protein 4B [Lingula anatina]|uniref:Lysosomal-associated transmembrane protein 4B n=1 Tax=Lingula anatina TaxID=7574 RepID=A0A1S3HRR4_LINAN|nr:lysosomal-associated transmembrane protein 4B [Lingula anatina]|eukprot:XP_013388236.1 lysosomal-associated transmembrane protein 4B [Lingula anatina]
MKTCCCCCSLRTGSVFSGVWGLLFASLALAAYIFFVITLEIAGESLGTGQPDTASVLNTIYGFQNRYTVYVGLAVSFLWFISCIVLFAGICVKNRWCLVPWLVFTILATLYLIAVLVLVLVYGVVLLYTFWLFWVIVGVLFLIIVFDAPIIMLNPFVQKCHSAIVSSDLCSYLRGVLFP